MDFYKTTAAFGATACLLMASSAFAADIRSETFEGNDDVGAWTGSVAQEADTYTAPTPAGLPISATVGSKVLSVAGNATNTVSAANGDTLVDMMVKVSVPDAALAGLGEEAADAKFAIAVDTVANETTGQFKYYDGSAWQALSTATYADGTWVRLTMKFYYSAGKCVVALDGNTCGEFNLLGAAVNLASIEVKGSTSLDEVLVTQDKMVAAFADETAVQGGIQKSWLTAYNIPWGNAGSNAPDYTTSGLTIAQKYAYGLDPADGSKFTLDFVQNADSSTAVFTFPGAGAYGGTGSYELQGSADQSTWSAVSAAEGTASGLNTFTFALPESLKYYRVVAKPASGS